MRRLLVAASVLGLVLALPVAAETFVRTGGQYELPASHSIEGNFLAVGMPASVSGEVVEDAVVLGNQVTVSGTVGGDLLTAAIISQLDGEVKDDVRIVGGTVTISGQIAGDVVIAADTVKVLSGASIGGDVLLYARNATVAGQIDGSVKGSIRNLTLNGVVGKAVDVNTTQLVIGSTASITESVRYTSDNLATPSVDAVIGGSLFRNDPIVRSGTYTLSGVVFPFLIFLFSTLLWLFLSKRTLHALVSQTVSFLPRSAVTGLVSLIAFPIIIFLLFLSMLGSYVALLGVFGYITLLLLTIAALPALLGHACMRVSNMNTTTITPLTILIGSIVCAVLLLLPQVGIFILIFISVIVFGGLVEGIIRAGR